VTSATAYKYKWANSPQRQPAQHQRYKIPIVKEIRVSQPLKPPRLDAGTERIERKRNTLTFKRKFESHNPRTVPADAGTEWNPATAP